MVVCVAFGKGTGTSLSRRSSASEPARQKCVCVLGTARAVSVIVGALILDVSIKFAKMTKRIWGLIPASSLQTRHDQSANSANLQIRLI